MELFQEFFVTTLLTLVFACVIAKLVVSVALCGDDKAADKVKVVEKQGTLDKRGLRVKGTKSNKRVEFADDVVVKHVDYMFEVEEEIRDFDSEVKSVVDYYYDYDFDVCDKGSESSGILVESMDEVIVEETSEKGENLKRVDQVEDQRVIVDERSENGENVKRVNQIEDLKVIVEEISEKGENLARVDQVEDQRVTIEEKGENGEILTRADQVDHQKVIVEEKSENGAILTRSDQVDDQKVNEDGKLINCSGEVAGVCVDDGDKVSTNIGLLGEAWVREIVDEKSENGAILTRSDQVDDQRVNEDGKLVDSSDKIVGVCLDDGARVSTDIGLLDKAFAREIVDEKSEDIKSDESSSVKEENIVVEEKMKHVEVEIDDVAIVLKEESGFIGLGENQGGLSKGDEDERKEINDNVLINDDDDDDWEGIERTELEKRFGEAVNNVECGVKGKDDQLANLGSDVQMQLYGLHKIAVEGPCHEPQPMALNFSARAKWNAWQKLGSMSREVAMEEYIKLLSEHSKSSFQDIRPNIILERELEPNYITRKDDPILSGNSD